MKHECTTPSEKKNCKNIALGNFKAIAKAALEHTELKEELFLEVLTEIKKEVKKYAKSGDCALRVTTPAVVTSFTNGSFLEQFMERCPKLCHVLTNIVNTGKSQLYSKEDTLSLSH